MRQVHAGFGDYDIHSGVLHGTRTRVFFYVPDGFYITTGQVKNVLENRLC